MKKLILMLCLVVTFLSGCGLVYTTYTLQPIRVEGTYHGQILDAETGDPVAGVVVLGVWYTSFAGVAGSISHFSDAREVVTDAHGDFALPGMGLRLMSFLGPPHISIFKAGYDYFSTYSWDELEDTLVLKHNVRWEGGKAIIRLKKLTWEERKERIIRPDPPTEADKAKVILMLKEVNKEMMELGYRRMALS